jgi:hypothetical protein
MVLIEGGGNSETGVIASIGSLVLTTGLTNSYPADSTVTLYATASPTPAPVLAPTPASTPAPAPATETVTTVGTVTTSHGGVVTTETVTSTTGGGAGEKEEEDGDEDDESIVDGVTSLIAPIVGAAVGVLGVLALSIFAVCLQRKYSWLERLDLRFWAKGKPHCANPSTQHRPRIPTPSIYSVSVSPSHSEVRSPAIKV